ncbi:hypothetical protein PtrSN002B_009771 [Pyrenophora tritici-repentis]|nr:hypothetical protein PtrSN001A_009549 [Pyrenophora tritici-repentis]KAI1535872.1 hypothetical protein PtrSN002B_009771 [Pyrenophora tritici-repentis]KAI1562841.1 hypothetical protein PtrEW4_009746 [Pyrenophora tritici-repentis]KAI1581908.1 hypothetical protein PtrEW13061_009438 [Pyrenophora tritici-repentis]
MIAKTHIEDCVAKVVAVEEEPERVHYPVTLIHDDQWYRRVASSAYNFLPSIFPSAKA